jgi:hypothetical protein
MLRRMQTSPILFRRRSGASRGSSQSSPTAGQPAALLNRLAAFLLVGVVAALPLSCQPAEPTDSEPDDAPTVSQPAALADTPAAPADETERDAPGAELQSADPLSAPPSGCWAERSCGARKYVCKRPDSPRPCGAAGCSELQFTCSSDAGCLEGYRCALCKPGDPFPCSFATGICRPAACASDRDCGSPNLVCQGGACAHKTCRSSRACRGYCVAGSCWNKAGWCHDTSLPPPP